MGELESSSETEGGKVRIIGPIPPHPGFETIELPGGNLIKTAYGEAYLPGTEDLEIELGKIKELEIDHTNFTKKLAKDETLEDRIRKLKFHYKRAISIISPQMSAGWNRWSEDILGLFLTPTRYRTCWGSGNCGKSAVFALLLYVKWRVAPNMRMVVIASAVAKEATSRVIAYIKNVHSKAPESKTYKFGIRSDKDTNGVFFMLRDNNTGKYITDERACIVSLPVKVDAKGGTIGDNLMGKHPQDKLILAFDEAQELPANLTQQTIFANWLTNINMEVDTWGNPQPIDFYQESSWDLLFKLGAGSLSVQTLKVLQGRSDKTATFNNGRNSTTLHLTMLDSPKDDSFPGQLESNMTINSSGEVVNRLSFLAGGENVKAIEETVPKGCAAWMSQVLGWPYIDVSGELNPSVINSAIVKEASSYPLIWKNEINETQYFMGVDGSGRGSMDPSAIVVAKVGMMQDGRMGIDLMGGKYCLTIRGEDGGITDETIREMQRLSTELRIPPKNIAVETHGSSEVLRYALQKHIARGKWDLGRYRGQSFLYINPTVPASDMPMFKTIGKMQPAKEMVSDFNTEIYVALRCLVMNKQLFNIPINILNQLYNRLLNKNSAGTKYKVETKAEMRKRKASSPNDADALAYMVHLLRIAGFRYTFVQSGKYLPVYGKEYAERQKHNVVAQRMSLLSSILNIAQPTLPPARRKEKFERRSRHINDIDAI